MEETLAKTKAKIDENRDRLETLTKDHKVEIDEVRKGPNYRNDERIKSLTMQLEELKSAMVKLRAALD